MGFSLKICYNGRSEFSGEAMHTMTVIVCLDNTNGMRFNHRRQSRDAAVIADICATVGSGKLLICPCSEALFPAAAVTVCEAPLAAADRGDYCFIENDPLADCGDRIERVIVYRWNRDYPADVFLDLDLRKYRLESTAEFSGTSHDKITKEVYIR